MDAFGSFGGIAKYNRDFLRALCSAPEVQEVVAVPRRMAAPPQSLPPKLTYLTQGLPDRCSYIKAIIRLLQHDADFALIVCGHLKLLPMAWLAGMLTKAPTGLLIYGIDAWRPLKNPIMRYALSKIAFLISISEITKQKFLQWSRLTPRRAFVLPNAVMPEHYGAGDKPQPLLERYGLGGKTVLMTLGRLAAEEQYKGFDEILELLPKLAESIPDLAYLIVGDGDDRPRLAAKARALGVADRVVFAGFVPEAEKADHYRLADAFVMPGRGEGFGFVFLEALACGIQAVGSTRDGSREALRDGTLGILVDPDRPAEIAAGVLAALRQPRGVVPAGLEYFSFKNFERRTHDILRDMINAGSAG
jgi:glycosyltransferase involved in cell wall biosynthesis